MKQRGTSAGWWNRLWAFVSSPVAGFGRPRRLATLATRAEASNDDPRKLLQIADDYRLEGEIDRAVRTYWRAVHAHRRHGDNLKALALLKRIVGLASNDPNARASLADVLESVGRRPEAANEYRAAAVLTQSAGRPNAARRLWDRAERLSPLPRSEAQRFANFVSTPAPTPEPAPVPVAAVVETPKPIANLASEPPPRAEREVVPAPAPEPDPLPDISRWPSIPDPADARPVAEAVDEAAFPDVVIASPRPHGLEASVDVVVTYTAGTSTEIALDAEDILLGMDPTNAVTVGYSALDIAPDQRPTETATALDPLRRAG